MRDCELDDLELEAVAAGKDAPARVRAVPKAGARVVPAAGPSAPARPPMGPCPSCRPSGGCPGGKCPLR